VSTARPSTADAASEAARQYDVFVIYAEADAAFAKGYLLEALGVPSERVLLSNELAPGASLISEIARGVTSSALTIVVLSQAYLRDRWAVFGDQLAGYASGVDARLVPVLLEDCQVPLHLDFRVALDFRKREHWAEETERLRRALGSVPRTPSTTATSGWQGRRLAIATALFVAMLSLVDLLGGVFKRWQPAQRDANAATRSTSDAATARDGSATACNIPEIPSSRITIVDDGVRDFKAFGADLPKRGLTMLTLRSGGAFVGALSFELQSESGLFRVQRVQDASCHSVDDYANATRGGDKRVLQNWDELELVLQQRTYRLELGYDGGEIEVNYFHASAEAEPTSTHKQTPTEPNQRGSAQPPQDVRQADFLGDWRVVGGIPDLDGQTYLSDFSFKQHATGLAGVANWKGTETPLRNVRVSGAALEFVTTADVVSGRRTAVETRHFRASLVDDGLRLTIRGESDLVANRTLQLSAKRED
jgi:hypothetical protein